METLNLVWLVPLLPLAGFIVNFFLGRKLKLSETTVSVIGCGTVLVSLLITLGALYEYGWVYAPAHQNQPYMTPAYFTWMPGGFAHLTLGKQAGGIASLSVPWSYQIDQLSLLMMLIVTFVGFWIHVFSAGYMRGDRGLYRFFAYMNLFMFAMLTLVMASNFLIMFIGWEGVGLCSYLLIGYYFDRREAGDAAKKAFVVNRIGDFGFIIAIMGMFATFGTFQFTDIAKASQVYPVEGLGFAHFGLMSWLALGLFIGAVGKSAQIPLYIWLPDAMAGPTPVSALIHAATMVTAGVFMITRTNFIFQRSATMMAIVAIVGCLTAFVAATIAVTQTDIKKVLAYSTVSQLGYMFLGLGAGAFVGGIFHLFTHAFFKALLFLGAGSVIHAMHHEQEMPRMGGLSKHLTTTYKCMVAAWLAICGIVPLAGFWSKDEILGKVFSTTVFPGGKILWLIGFATAGITAFYMTRLMAMTFWGDERFRKIHAGGEADEAYAAAVDKGAAPHDATLTAADDRPFHRPGEHVGVRDEADEEASSKIRHRHFEPRESPKVMTLPLIVLAVFSVIAGFVGVPRISAIDKWLSPVVVQVGQGLPSSTVSAEQTTTGAAVPEPEQHFEGYEFLLMLLSLGIALAGIYAGRIFYLGKPQLVTEWTERLKPLYKLSLNKWYWDDLVDVKGVEVAKMANDALWGFDADVVDGGVNGASWTTRAWAWASGIFDKYVIDGAVKVTSWATYASSLVLRAFQTGFWQNYALFFAIGLLLAMLLYDVHAVPLVLKSLLGHNTEP
ncbi:MAG TPA: NADH-quinone oxidoreductase subunit L [Blastocatellia bacterium]|nr:NADH-quinone oxidoreductase subunit L [Blastocatellia bacterium]